MNLEQRMDARFGSLEQRIDARLDALGRRFASMSNVQTATFVVLLTGTAGIVAALVAR